MPPRDRTIFSVAAVRSSSCLEPAEDWGLRPADQETVVQSVQQEQGSPG
jgi:hypothetical protein